MASSATESQK